MRTRLSLGAFYYNAIEISCGPSRRDSARTDLPLTGAARHSQEADSLISPLAGPAFEVGQIPIDEGFEV